MKRILVAEDDPDVSALVKTLLEAAGHEVRIVEDGERALEAFQNEGADVVLLDVLLPGRNGFQVAEAIRGGEVLADVPLVMLSGVYKGPTYRGQARRRFGAVDYLEKPLEVDQLLTAVLLALEGRKAPIPDLEPEEEATQMSPDPGVSATDPSLEPAADATTDRSPSAPPEEPDETAVDPEKEAVRSLRQAARALSGGEPSITGSSAAPTAPVRAPRPSGPIAVDEPGHTDRLLAALQSAPGPTTDRHLRPLTPPPFARESRPAPPPPEAPPRHVTTTPLPPDPTLGFADPESLREKRQVERAARAVTRSAAQGDLRHTPFPILLYRLFKERISGALLVVKDPVKKIVYFREGVPVFVKSNLLSECLGKVLVRERLITDAQCRESLRLLQETKRQQGALLLQMGALSEQNLVYGLQLQLRTKLYEIFSWPAGEYRLSTRTKPPDDAEQLESSIEEILFEGIRSAFDPERLRRELEPALDLYVLVAREGRARLVAMAMPAGDRVIVETIDGSRTIREILAQSPAGPGSAAQLVYALLCAEIVETLTHPAQPAAPPVETEPEPAPLVETAPAASPPAEDTAAMDGPPAELPASTAELMAAPDVPIFPLDELDSLVERTLAAEHHYHRAEGFLDQKRYEDALRALQKANTLCPDQPDFQASLGWALFCVRGEAAADEALLEIQRALESAPRFDRAYLLRGWMWKAMGRLDEATRDFEEALSCNPACAEAIRELEVLRAT